MNTPNSNAVPMLAANIVVATPMKRAGLAPYHVPNMRSACSAGFTYRIFLLIHAFPHAPLPFILKFTEHSLASKTLSKTVLPIFLLVM